MLVFQPIAKILGDPFLFGLMGFGSRTSGAILVAFVIITFGIFKEVLDIANALAGYAAAAYSRKETSGKKVERYRRAFRGIAYLTLAAIASLFFLPFIAGINSALAGIVLVILVFWAIIVLFRTDWLFTGEIHSLDRRVHSENRESSTGDCL